MFAEPVISASSSEEGSPTSIEANCTVLLRSCRFLAPARALRVLVAVFHRVSTFVEVTGARCLAQLSIFAGSPG